MGCAGGSDGFAGEVRGGGVGGRAEEDRDDLDSVVVCEVGDAGAEVGRRVWRRGELALCSVAEGAAQERRSRFRRLQAGDGGVEDRVAQAGQVDHVVEEGDRFELVLAEDGVGVQAGGGCAAGGLEGFGSVVFRGASRRVAGAGVAERRAECPVGCK